MGIIIRFCCLAGVWLGPGWSPKSNTNEHIFRAKTGSWGSEAPAPGLEKGEQPLRLGRFCSKVHLMSGGEEECGVDQKRL